MAIPASFSKLMNQLVNDIKICCPEYLTVIAEWKDISNDDEHALLVLLVHYIESIRPYCQEIIQRDDSLFSNPDNPAEFLPNISFTHIWHSGISDRTKKTIWVYLSLLIVSIIKTSSEPIALDNIENICTYLDSFLVNATVRLISHEVDTPTTDEDDDGTTEDGTTEDNPFGIFMDFMQKESDNSEAKTDNDENSEFKEALESLLDGKFGQIAKSIAIEIAHDLGIDENSTPQELADKLCKNPDIMKEILTKTNERITQLISSDTIKPAELLEEIQGMAEKLKTIPGLKEMIDPLMKAMSGKNKKSTVDPEKLKRQMYASMRRAAMAEKHKQNKEREKEKQHTQTPQHHPPKLNDDELAKLFARNEPAMKSRRKN